MRLAGKLFLACLVPYIFGMMARLLYVVLALEWTSGDAHTTVFFAWMFGLFAIFAAFLSESVRSIKER